MEKNKRDQPAVYVTKLKCSGVTAGVQKLPKGTVMIPALIALIIGLLIVKVDKKYHEYKTAQRRAREQAEIKHGIAEWDQNNQAFLDRLKKIESGEAFGLTNTKKP